MDPEQAAEDARLRLAHNVRRLAARKGLTLVQVADFAGVARPHLERVLALKAGATIPWVAKVAAAIGVDITDLLKPIEQQPVRGQRRGKAKPKVPAAK